jgi:hypothetical protein
VFLRIGRVGGCHTPSETAEGDSVGKKGDRYNDTVLINEMNCTKMILMCLGQSRRTDLIDVAVTRLESEILLPTNCLVMAGLNVERQVFLWHPFPVRFVSASGTMSVHYPPLVRPTSLKHPPTLGSRMSSLTAGTTLLCAKCLVGC